MNHPQGRIFSKPQRSMRNNCVCLTSVFSVLVLLAGCQENGLERAPVAGLVTLDGKPLTQGVIFFIPQKGRAAQGKLGPDGSFTLSTYGKSDGATLGKHQVSIIACDEEPAFESEVEPKWLIPRRYGSGATSGLEFEVKPGAENKPQFDLSSK